MVRPEKGFRRRFLVERLPEPIVPADDHLQIFENYLKGTNLRLKSVRRPSTDERNRFLERVEWDGRFAVMKTTFQLEREDYEAMRPLRGREIRKNRYSFESEGIGLDIDVFLGPLWGLNTAAAWFETESEAESFEMPESCILDISEDPFFEGPNLADRNFEDVRDRFEKAKGGD
jgi:CYTH domain-containing protein